MTRKLNCKNIEVAQNRIDPIEELSDKCDEKQTNPIETSKKCVSKNADLGVKNCKSSMQVSALKVELSMI